MVFQSKPVFCYTSARFQLLNILSNYCPVKIFYAFIEFFVEKKWTDSNFVHRFCFIFIFLPKKRGLY